MRRIVIASHGRMAEGVKHTLDFITGGNFNIYAVSAYVDDTPLSSQISSLFSSFDISDEVIVLTDMISGSVNQEFMSFRNNNVFLIAGINIPLALAVLLENDSEPLNEQRLSCLVEEAKMQMQLIDCSAESMEGDE